jgi:predicted nuclease with TOPRIM domain
MISSEEVMDMIATLEYENKMIRARNERLENEYADLERKYDVLKNQCDLYKRQIGTDTRGTDCCKVGD